MALDLNDKTGNGSTLTNNGAAESSDTPFAASTVSAAFTLTEGDYLYCDDNVPLSITGDLTIEAWVNMTSNPDGTTMAIVAKMTGTPNDSYRLFLQQYLGVCYIGFTVSATGSGVTTKNVTWTPSTATWYHLAVVYDASAGTGDFYVNGSQQGVQQTGYPNSIYDSNAVFRIGAKGDNTQYADAKIDEVRVWSVTRTQAEISNNMNIRLTGKESGLVAYYPFEALPELGLRSRMQRGVGI